MRKFLLLLVPLAALLAGCVSVDSSYVVNEDGSGSQTVRVSIPAEAMASLASLGSEGAEAPSLEDSLAEMEADPDIQALRDALGDRGAVTVFSSDEEGVGFELVINVPSSDDFTAALQAIIADLPQDTELPFTGVSEAEPPATIRRDGDTWTLEAQMEPLTDQDVADLAGDPEAAGFASLFMDQMTVTTSVSLPGKVVEHNADEVLDDGTLVWRQQGLDEGRTLTARSEVGGSNALRIALIVAGALGVAVVIAALAYFATRRGGAGGGETPA